jgi:hypothetical protein
VKTKEEKIKGTEKAREDILMICAVHDLRISFLIQ